VNIHDLVLSTELRNQSFHVSRRKFNQKTSQFESNQISAKWQKTRGDIMAAASTLCEDFYLLENILETDVSHLSFS